MIYDFGLSVHPSVGSIRQFMTNTGFQCVFTTFDPKRDIESLFLSVFHILIKILAFFMHNFGCWRDEGAFSDGVYPHRSEHAAPNDLLFPEGISWWGSAPY
jgi:hypothetical protein